MVTGGPIDVLTGDWLAELTMLILAKNRLRDPKTGYAKTFVTQMEQVMGECLDRGVRVVSNAGGLEPAACADAVFAVAQRLGLDPRIAYVQGDNILDRLAELRDSGIDFTHLDTGEPLGDREVMTANVYLGGWGITEALASGADIVITGRVTDASLAMGPAAWYHSWARHDWNQLAGALVAGHVLECGTQATGGNYSFFGEIDGLEHPGFPIAEIDADGSAVITKHPGHGGNVSVGTVTAQLLYEITEHHYLNPDVVARFDSVRLDQVGADRVRISGTVGSPPPRTAKVAINCESGYRSTNTLYLTGLDIRAKAQLLEDTLRSRLDRHKFDSIEFKLEERTQDDPPTNAAAMSELRIVAKADNTRALDSLSRTITELALATYPGIFMSVGSSAPHSYGIYWPALISSDLIHQEVVMGDDHIGVLEFSGERADPNVEEHIGTPDPAALAAYAELAGSRRMRRAPLGRAFGTRSGDKGGNANLGIWATSDLGYLWLRTNLTIERLQELLPEVEPFVIERFEFDNLRSLNFVIVGLLGEGVASSTRLDSQAKSLGEWLRARLVELPEELLHG
jgi:hypothetical protein